MIYDIRTKNTSFITFAKFLKAKGHKKLCTTSRFYMMIL